MIFHKKQLARIVSTLILLILTCGCSSVVERHVANVNVVGSNLITRFGNRPQGWGSKDVVIEFWKPNSIGEIPARISQAWVADTYVSLFFCKDRK